MSILSEVERKTLSSNYWIPGLSVIQEFDRYTIASYKNQQFIIRWDRVHSGNLLCFLNNIRISLTEVEPPFLYEGAYMGFAIVVEEDLKGNQIEYFAIYTNQMSYCKATLPSTIEAIVLPVHKLGSWASKTLESSVQELQHKFNNQMKENRFINLLEEEHDTID